MNIGEEVEFGAVPEIGIEAAGFDSDSRQLGGRGQSLRFGRAGFGGRVECGKDRAEGRTMAGGNVLAQDSHR